MARAIFLLTVMQFFISSVVLAQTTEEASQRVQEAQEKLRAEKQAAHQPNVLLERIRELEDENRRLKAEVLSLRNKLKEMGVHSDVKIDAKDNHVADPKVITSLAQFTKLLPLDAMPRKEDISNPDAWGQIHKEAMQNAIAKLSNRTIFRNAEATVEALPMPANLPKHDGWYKLTLTSPTPPGTAEGYINYLNIVWSYKIIAYVKPTTAKEKRELMDIKLYDRLFLSGRFVDNGSGKFRGDYLPADGKGEQFEWFKWYIGPTNAGHPQMTTLLRLGCSMMVDKMSHK